MLSTRPLVRRCLAPSARVVLFVKRAGFGVVMVVVLRAVVLVSVQVRRLLVLACWG